MRHLGRKFQVNKNPGGNEHAENSRVENGGANCSAEKFVAQFWQEFKEGQGQRWMIEPEKVW